MDLGVGFLLVVAAVILLHHWRQRRKPVTLGGFIQQVLSEFGAGGIVPSLDWPHEANFCARRSTDGNWRVNFTSPHERGTYSELLPPFVAYIRSELSRRRLLETTWDDAALSLDERVAKVITRLLEYRCIRDYSPTA